jgi:DNA-binding response OmpR family regulator
LKKVLIIDEAEMFREYLGKKFTENNFEVSYGLNGLDGSLKLRKVIPDLIIMDYMLSRKSCQEVLAEKQSNPNTKNTPVILMSNKIDKKKIAEFARFNVKKIYPKPVKMDLLFQGISELMDVKIELDDTPCIIEAHLNDEVLFIEIAKGLNTEKIELLKYKIDELLKLYQTAVPRFLLMMSSLDINDSQIFKLRVLLETILDKSGYHPEHIRILTNSDVVEEYVKSTPGIKDIGLTNNLSTALDDLIGIKGDNFAQDKIVGETLLAKPSPNGADSDSFQMRFDNEKTFMELETIGDDVSIAIVDDDLVIRQLVKTVFKNLNWEINLFENGQLFLDTINEKKYDLVFLDLMMPVLDGFSVLKYLQENNINNPVIIFSALSKKETVLEAVTYGVKSYMIKPLKPDAIKRKTAEVLRSEF